MNRVIWLGNDGLYFMSENGIEKVNECFNRRYTQEELISLVAPKAVE